MTIYLATRHWGAMQWLQKHGYTGVVQALWSKSMTEQLQRGDVVIGNLPIHVIDKILAKDARVFLIGVPGYPGKKRHKNFRDLTPEEMDEKGAFLTEVITLIMRPVDLGK